METGKGEDHVEEHSEVAGDIADEESKPENLQRHVVPSAVKTSRLDNDLLPQAKSDVVVGKKSPQPVRLDPGEEPGYRFGVLQKLRTCSLDRAGKHILGDHECKTLPPRTDCLSNLLCRKFLTSRYEGNRDNIPVFGQQEPFWTESKVIDGLCLACCWLFDHMRCVFEEQNVYVEH
jgi:hypothetical protein